MKKATYFHRRIAVAILSVLCLGGLSNHPGMADPGDYSRGNTNQDDVVWFVPTDEKIIALTFDDGPDPVFTPKVLSMLAKYNVTATFFVIGECVDEYPETARMIVGQGSEIANHSYTHRNFTAIGSARMKEEIDRTDAAILTATGVRPRLFRPPHGTCNDELINIVRSKGYKVVLWTWTQDTRDWRNPGICYIVNKVLKNAQNGDIVIFHDAGRNRNQTVAALDTIIPKLQERGFKLMTVSELLTHKGREATTPESQDTFLFE